MNLLAATQGFGGYGLGGSGLGQSGFGGLPSSAAGVNLAFFSSPYFYAIIVALAAFEFSMLILGESFYIKLVYRPNLKLYGDNYLSQKDQVGYCMMVLNKGAPVSNLRIESHVVPLPGSYSPLPWVGKSPFDGDYEPVTVWPKMPRRETAYTWLARQEKDGGSVRWALLTTGSGHEEFLDVGKEYEVDVAVTYTTSEDMDRKFWSFPLKVEDASLVRGPIREESPKKLFDAHAQGPG